MYGGTKGGVVDVLGIPLAVAITVCANQQPGAGNYLHPTHAAVVHGVLIESSAIGILNQLAAVGPIEHGSVDPGAGFTMVIEPVVVMLAVIRLSPTDGGQQRPRKIATIVSL